MSLLLTMLPIYLFGNLHCMGMCGPLVAMLGKHRYRHYYFFGRIFSFTLAGALAGGAGAILDLFLMQYHIPALTSFIFGSAILLLGINVLLGWSYPGQQFLARKMSRINQNLSILMLRDQPLPAFLFGFFTIALPCGQTVIVYSACALAGDVYVGMLNGFVFALLTTPSLFMAMHAHTILSPLKKHYQTVIGISAIIVGMLSLLRGLAELGAISHLVLNHRFHIVLY